MKKVLIFSGLAIALGSFVWNLLPSNQVAQAVSPRQRATPRAALASFMHKSSAERLSWKWQTGAAVTYDFTNSTLLSLDAEHEVGVTVSGCWHVLVLDDGQADGTVDLATVFSAARYATGGTPATFYSQLLEQMPCVLRMTREGRLLGTEFPAYVQADDRQILAGLTAVQVQLATPDATGSWTGEEQDANGTVAVSYQTRGPGVIHKQRTAFTRLSAQGIGPDAVLRITASDFTATPGPLWLQSFEGQETMEFQYQGQCSWRGRQQVKLTARADQALPDVLASLANFPTAAAAVAQLGRDLPAVIQLAGSGSVTDLETAAARAAQYANIDFTTIMKGFDETMAAANCHAERQPAIEALRDWLLARPEEAVKLEVHLANRALTEESSGCILNALELSSASPASQAVLATVLGDAKGETYSPAMLVQAVIAAGGVGEITDQALMDHLYQLAFTPAENPANAQASDSAILALGTLARTNPAIRDRLAAELEQTFDSASPASEGLITSALMTLTNGNIHNDALNATATRLLAESPSENIRSDALAYLHSTGDSAGTLAALADKSTAIQSRALELLTGADEMAASNVEAITAILRNPAADEAVRSTAARLLKRHADTNADIAVAYHDTLVQNPPKNFREVIESLTAKDSAK